MNNIFKLNIFVIIFILFTQNSILSHIEHYSNIKKLKMEVLRNNKVIGYNLYFFSKNGNETIVTNQMEFEVKLLGVNVFKVKGYSKETYINDQLISFNSKTYQNDKEKFVNLSFDVEKKEFNVNGSSYNGKASLNNVIGSWWNRYKQLPNKPYIRKY